MLSLMIVLFQIVTCNSKGNEFYNTLDLMKFLILVSLNSSTVRVCHGDTLVFTCITDTGALIWGIDGSNQVFFEPEQLNSIASLGIFALSLINITGTTLVSTATVHDVIIENNGTIIACSDSNNKMIN